MFYYENKFVIAVAKMTKLKDWSYISLGYLIRNLAEIKMAENKQLLPGDKYTEILNGGRICITKKSVQFGSSVYQFHNVTGFAVSKLQKNTLPMQFILALFIIGLFMANSPVGREIGIIIVLGAIGGILYNISQPDRYGFGLYLNSGHEKIFTTTDVQGVKEVVETLYKYIESDQELSAYVVNIVEGNVTGNFIGGNARDTKQRH